MQSRDVKKLKLPTPKIIRRNIHVLKGLFGEENMRRLEQTFGGSEQNYVMNVLRVMAACNVNFPLDVYRLDDYRFYFPGLTVSPFYDASVLSWTAHVSQYTKAIKEEVFGLIKEGKGFEHYDEYDSEIGGIASRLGSWKTCFLYRKTQRNEDALKLCPITAGIVSSIPNLMGDVFFSAIKAKSSLRIHTGPSNAKITCHLGLIIPQSEECFFSVGSVRKHWREGEWLIFDDSFPHYVSNNTPDYRVVLIIDVWHPDLTKVLDNSIQFIGDKFNW